MTALEAAYRATSYVVEGPDGQFALRVGERSPLLDKLLAQHGARSWVFITAHNPGSQLVSEDVNRQRQVKLERQVDAAGYRHYPGASVGDGAGDWPAEPSLLVVGITREAASTLGRAFGQKAILVGVLGEPAELLWL